MKNRKSSDGIRRNQTDEVICILKVYLRPTSKNSLLTYQFIAEVNRI
jgi:hypothetical protein